MTPDKPLPITKRMVWEAYQLVAGNGKAAGVDGQSLDEFAQDLGNNLYKLWNRMASGSYLPPAVKRVEIPKANGGIRPLGIPTVADRVAQMVVKQYLEPELDRVFDPDSYGYRPGKSAHQAIEQTRSGRHGIYDIRVTNQAGETVAMFRGKSAQIKGTVLPEDR